MTKIPNYYNKYQRDKYHNDAEYRAAKNKADSERIMNLYNTDQEYREKRKAQMREYVARKKAELKLKEQNEEQ